MENYLADADENFYVTNKYELPIASGMKMIVSQEESGFSLKDLTVNDKKIDKEKEYSILLTDTTMSVLKKQIRNVRLSSLKIQHYQVHGPKQCQMDSSRQHRKTI